MRTSYSSIWCTHLVNGVGTLLYQLLHLLIIARLKMLNQVVRLGILYRLTFDKDDIGYVIRTEWGTGINVIRYRY